MIHGLDTSFLVAVTMQEHAEHGAARQTLARLLTATDHIAVAPQVLAEFIHVATDPRRFRQPLDMATACRAADQWWTSRDVVQVFPNDGAVHQFFGWLGNSPSVASGSWTLCLPQPTTEPVLIRSSRPIQMTSLCSAFSPA
jgi:hypothetical protein